MYKINQEQFATLPDELKALYVKLPNPSSEEVRECFPETKPTKPHGGDGGKLDTQEMGWGFKRMPSELSDNGGNASRFFKSILYYPKASKSERNKGCEGLGEKQYSHDGRNKEIENPYQRNKSVATNNHPTVKPTALMEYLIKMITPPGGICLDPFAGSGSTLVAAKENGFNFIGVELTEEYIPIIEARTGEKAEKIDPQNLDPQNIVADLIEKDLPLPPRQGGTICECGGKIKKLQSGNRCCEWCLTDY